MFVLELKIVAGNVSIKGNLEADFINKVNVTEKFQKAVFIDENYTLPNIVFEDLSGMNLNLLHNRYNSTIV